MAVVALCCWRCRCVWRHAWLCWAFRQWQPVCCWACVCLSPSSVQPGSFICRSIRSESRALLVMLRSASSLNWHMHVNSYISLCSLFNVLCMYIYMWLLKIILVIFVLIACVYSNIYGPWDEAVIQDWAKTLYLSTVCVRDSPLYPRSPQDKTVS